MPSIISGVPGHAVEVYQDQRLYLPAQGRRHADNGRAAAGRNGRMTIPSRHGSVHCRHNMFICVTWRNIEFNHVEFASVTADARPSFWLGE